MAGNTNARINETRAPCRTTPKSYMIAQTRASFPTLRKGVRNRTAHRSAAAIPEVALGATLSGSRGLKFRRLRGRRLPRPVLLLGLLVQRQLERVIAVQRH